MTRKVLHVIPRHRDRGISADVETWRVVADGTNTTGPVTRLNKASEFRVRAERDPDQVCAEVAIAGETTHPSVVASNRRALDLAKSLACGSAVACPGIVACIEGAACPYALK